MMNVLKTRPVAEKIWPKGFPLRDRKNFDSDYVPTNSSVETLGIRVTFQKNCPDLDALGRLSEMSFKFEEKNPLVLKEKQFSPFGLKSALWNEKLFPAIFLPVSKMTVADIWRSYIAEKLAHIYNIAIIFEPPMVKGTCLNLTKNDYFEEWSLFSEMNILVEILSKIKSQKSSMLSTLYEIYKELYDANLVSYDDLIIFSVWQEHFDGILTNKLLSP